MTTTLIFVPPGHDDIELARCENTNAMPRVGDEVRLTMIITANFKSINDPRKIDYASFRVVSISWDLKNTLLTESWMEQKEMFVPGKPSYAYLRVEPLDDATRTYVERRLLSENESAS